MTTDRRDRLDAAIEAMAADSSYTPLVRRLCCLRGISTLTGFGWRWRSGIGTGSAAPRSAPSWDWCRPRTLRENPGPKAQSPRPATGMPAGCWWRPPGITVRATITPADRCGTGGSLPPPPPGSAAMKATGGCTHAGKPSRPATKGHHRRCRHRPRARRLGLVAGCHGRLATPKPMHTLRPAATALWRAAQRAAVPPASCGR